jgi:hypothetical protein
MSHWFSSKHDTIKFYVLSPLTLKTEVIDILFGTHSNFNLTPHPIHLDWWTQPWFSSFYSRQNHCSKICQKLFRSNIYILFQQFLYLKQGPRSLWRRWQLYRILFKLSRMMSVFASTSFHFFSILWSLVSWFPVNLRDALAWCNSNGK